MSAETQAALARALDLERERHARVGLKLRALGSLGYLGHALLLSTAASLPTARAVLPTAALYALLAWALFLAVKLRPRLWRLALPSVPLLDLPCIFHAVSRAMDAATPETARFQAGAQIGGLLMFLMWSQLALDSRYLLASALVGLLLELGLIAQAGLLHNLQAIGNAAIMIASVTALAIYIPRRFTALLRRVVEESEGRVREVTALNQELRRQIGDRAGQLAQALGRLAVRHQQPALAPGALVEERYRVVRQLGQGGMGAVYQVERLADGAQLALKVLAGGVDPGRLARLAREGEIAARLDHPNLVAIRDLDVGSDGTLFLVLELVPGASLGELRAQFGDARWAAPILLQIARALAAMHGVGIVHRDLKPGNVLLDGARAKVADFGIASLLATPPEPSPASGEGSSPLTRTGAILGTPAYMAPELAHGAREATPASDLFSFGVLAFELLAGQLPHASAPVLERLVGRAPPAPRSLRALRPDLPEPLAQLVDRCLATAPEARPTALEAAQRLEALDAAALPAGRPALAQPLAAGETRDGA